MPKKNTAKQTQQPAEVKANAKPSSKTPSAASKPTGQSGRAKKKGFSWFKVVVFALVVGLALDAAILYLTKDCVVPAVTDLVEKFKIIDWRIVVIDLLFLKPVCYLCGIREGSNSFDRQLWNLFTHNVPPSVRDDIRSVDFTVPTVYPPQSTDTYDIPVRLYIPLSAVKGENRVPLLVYYHGGGYVFGTSKDYFFDEFLRNLAKQSNFLILSVDYRLAPENPFPVPIEDCYAVLDWLGKHYSNYWPTKTAKQSLGADIDLLFTHTDFERVLVGGDSAGGNAAAVVSLMATKAHRNLPFKLKHQILLYPSFFHQPETESAKKYRGYPLFPYEIGPQMNKFYLRESLFLRPNATLFDNVFVNPLRETDAVLAEVPSATIIIATYDPLRDENILYSEKLRQLNVDVKTYQFDSSHAFMMVPFVPEAREATKQLVNNVKRVLAK